MVWSEMLERTTHVWRVAWTVCVLAPCTCNDGCSGLVERQAPQRELVSHKPNFVREPQIHQRLLSTGTWPSKMLRAAPMGHVQRSEAARAPRTTQANI